MMLSGIPLSLSDAKGFKRRFIVLNIKEENQRRISDSQARNSNSTRNILLTALQLLNILLKTDTDGDGLSDPEESTYGTNPLLADSDGDDYLDGEEVESGADPLDANDNPSEGLNWHVFKAAKDQKDAASE